MTDKQQRKEFRKNINPPVKQGDNVVGTGCLMFAFFLFVYLLGQLGLAVLLP